MTKLTRLAVVLALAALVACGDANTDDQTGELTQNQTPAASDPDAAVLFVSPLDGEEVTSPVVVQMEAHGVTIEPASAGINENAGHFHIMVNEDCVAEGEVIPTNETHLHFGMAQTEAEVILPPGDHTLCLQVADGAHTALPITNTIGITVIE